MAYITGNNDFAATLQNLWNPQPQTPQQIMTDATMQAQADQTQKAQIQQAVSNMMPQPSIEQILGYRAQILQNKRDYDNATTDDERRAANERANIIRAEALKRGIDLSQYSELGHNLNQAQTQFDLDRQGALQSIYDMENPNQRFYRLADEYEKSGMSRKKAELRAAYDNQKYQADWQKAVLGATYNYGVGDNALNENGMRLLTEAANYDPNAVAMLLKTHGTPIDEYNYDMWQRKALTTADIQKAMANMQHDFGLENMAKQHEYNADMANLNFGQQRWMAQFNADTAEKQAEFASKLRRREFEESADANLRAAQAAYNQVYELTGSHDAALAVLGSFYGGGNSGGNSGGKRGMTKEEATAANKTNQAIAEWKHAISASDATSDDIYGAYNKLEEIVAGQSANLADDVLQHVEDLKYVTDFYAQHQTYGSNDPRARELYQIIKNSPMIAEYLPNMDEYGESKTSTTKTSGSPSNNRRQQKNAVGYVNADDVGDTGNIYDDNSGQGITVPDSVKRAVNSIADAVAPKYIVGDDGKLIRVNR